MKQGILRPIYFLLMVSWLLGMQVTLAENDEEFERFKYKSEQNIAIDSNVAFFVLDIDPATAASMNATLSDLRLFSGDYELSYAVVPFNKEVERTERRLDVLNKGSYDDGSYSFVTVVPKDRSPSAKLVSKLEQGPYLVKGTLYGSNDNRNWQRLQPITIFNIDEQYSDIPLAQIKYDYLKIEFQQPRGESLTIQEASLVSAQQSRANDNSVWVEKEVQTTEADEESHLLIDLEHENRVSMEWMLETSQRGFHRQVLVEGSNDQDVWKPLGSTYVFRGLSKGDEKLSFNYGPARYRYLRIAIMNGDNEPLQVSSAKVRTERVRLVVKTPPHVEEGKVPLAAYWGNDETFKPAYDVKQLLGNIDLEQASSVQLESRMDNPAYEPVKMPLSERFPFLLPLILVFASLIVGYILYRNIKQVES